MKAAISDTMELRDDLENDLALAMLIERRHEQKIGSKQARDLINRIKNALGAANIENPSALPAQNLDDHFPFH